MVTLDKDVSEAAVLGGSFFGGGSHRQGDYPLRVCLGANRAAVAEGNPVDCGVGRLASGSAVTTCSDVYGVS